MRVSQLPMLAIAVFALGCVDGPTAPSLAPRLEVAPAGLRLQSGDLVEIDVRLSGCFHNHHLRASLRVDGDSAIVERFIGKSNFAERSGFRAVRALSQRQVDGLLGLLEDYGRPTKRACTSSEVGRISVTRAGVVVHVQEFRDSSCRWFVDRQEPAFHWYMLADVVKGSAQDLAS